MVLEKFFFKVFSIISLREVYVAIIHGNWFQANKPKNLLQPFILPDDALRENGLHLANIRDMLL